MMVTLTPLQYWRSVQCRLGHSSVWALGVWHCTGVARLFSVWAEVGLSGAADPFMSVAARSEAQFLGFTPF